MLMIKNYTAQYKHDYLFEFKGEKYLVHSIVRLTNEARDYLGARRNEVILTEVYYDHIVKRTFYVYQCQGTSYNSIKPINQSTDRLPDEMIEEIVTPATGDYASREIFGIDSPVYKKNGTKHTKKDWEIPEVRRGWIIFILVFIAAFIFQDWYVQLIIRIVAAWVFGKYRQGYVNAYTTYTHDEDDELLKSKYKALYGIYGMKFDEEETNNE